MKNGETVLQRRRREIFVAGANKFSKLRQERHVQADDAAPDGACAVFNLDLQICRAYGVEKL
jgi:hypothetical protein